MSQERTQPTLGFSTQCFFHGIAYRADDGSFFVFIQWIVSTLAIRSIPNEICWCIVDAMTNESPVSCHAFFNDSWILPDYF